MPIIDFIWGDGRRRLFFIELSIMVLAWAELFSQAVMGWRLVSATGTRQLLKIVSSGALDGCLLGRLVGGWMDHAVYGDWLGVIGHTLTWRLAGLVGLAIIYGTADRKDGQWIQGAAGMRTLLAGQLVLVLCGLWCAVRVNGAGDTAMAASDLHVGGYVLMIGSAALLVVSFIRMMLRGYRLYSRPAAPQD